MNVAIKYRGVVAADLLVSKALKVSEVSQMAKSEVRMREFLIASWAEFSKEAVERVVELTEKSANVEKILKEIDGVMFYWAEEAAPVVSKEMDYIFRLARDLGFKKATRQTEENLNYGLPKMVKKAKAKAIAEILPDFSLADEHAIEALKSHQVFWIGEHYKKNVSKIIAKRTKKTVLEAGLSPLEAGRVMRVQIRDSLRSFSIPGGFRGTNEQYFEALAANAATVARVNGQLRSFASIGITSYKISAVGDKRTCARCEHLNGKVFKTSQGVSLMEDVLNAENPDEIKSIHPWRSEKEIKEISPKPGKASEADSKALSDAGLSLPPFHYKCRCTVDISDEIGSYDDLEPIGLSVPKAPKMPVKKPPKIKKPKIAIPKEPERKLTPVQRWMLPYQDGLAPLDKVPLETQVTYRMNEEKISIEKALSKALEEKKSLAINQGLEIPKNLTEFEVGEVVKKTIVSELNITKNRKYVERKFSELESKIQRGSKRCYKRKAWALNAKRAEEAHKIGMEFVDDKLYEKAKKRMPRIFETRSKTGVSRGAFHTSLFDENKKEFSGIVVDNYKLIIEEKYSLQVLKHEYGHFLDTIGQNGRASIIARNLFAEEGIVILGPWGGDSTYIKGKWIDKYTGRIYSSRSYESISNIKANGYIDKGHGEMAGGSKVASEWFSSLTELLETNSDEAKQILTKLGKEWNNNPLRVSFMKSYLKGHFVE